MSKHTICACKAKYGGIDVSQAQEAKQLRDKAEVAFIDAVDPTVAQAALGIGVPADKLIAMEEQS